MAVLGLSMGGLLAVTLTLAAADTEPPVAESLLRCRNFPAPAESVVAPRIEHARSLNAAHAAAS